MVVAGAPASISNGHLTVKFEQDTGLMQSIATTNANAKNARQHGNQSDDNGNNNVEVSAKQTFYEYIDSEGGPYCLIMTGQARYVTHMHGAGRNWLLMLMLMLTMMVLVMMMAATSCV